MACAFSLLRVSYLDVVFTLSGIETEIMYVDTACAAAADAADFFDTYLASSCRHHHMYA